MKQIRRLLALTIYLSLFPSLCFADFAVTEDFSHPVGKAMSGGDCTAGYDISRIGQGSGPFIVDFQCGYGPVVISINNRGYIIYPTDEVYLGFSTKYENIDEKIKVFITPIKLIEKYYDPDSECTSYYRKVRVTIHFKGEKKVINGTAGGGCP
ncbi:MAG: hypothetical protein ACRDD3_05615 [Azovibrio sp.]